MTKVESDLFRLVTTLEGARVNWNDSCWRLHVEADVAALNLEVGEQVQQNVLVFRNYYNQEMKVAWCKALWSNNLLHDSDDFFHRDKAAHLMHILYDVYLLGIRCLSKLATSQSIFFINQYTLNLTN